MGPGNPIRWFMHPPAAEPAGCAGFDPAAFSPSLRTRLLILQPTPFCNIDCDYCYLPDRQNTARMDISTARRAVERLVEDSLLGGTLSVVWHAGEPLSVSPDYYEEAFLELVAAAGPRCALTHEIQTNATLITDEWCELFRRHSVRIGVSVDGPADLHDRHRKTRRGQGSHARVLDGMARLRAHGVPFHVIAVITRESLGRAKDIHDFFMAHGVEDVGLNFDEAEGAHAVSSLTGCEEAHRRFLGETLDLVLASGGRYRVREFLRAVDCVVGPPRQQRHLDVEWPENAQTLPFGIVSVAWNGDFSTFSPELLGQPGADHAGFVLGNVHRTGYLASCAGPAFVRLWQGILDGCRACEAECAYFAHCGGGAPANKFYEHGRFEATETLYCRTTLKRPLDLVLAAIEAGRPVSGLLHREGGQLVGHLGIAAEGA